MLALLEPLFFPEYTALRRVTLLEFCVTLTHGECWGRLPTYGWLACVSANPSKSQGDLHRDFSLLKLIQTPN